MDGESGGPYLNAALICEHVLRETDGVASAIRIVDRLTTTVQVGDAALPAQTERRNVAFAMLLHFRSGGARGEQLLQVEAEHPDGATRPLLAQPVYFDGGEEHGPVVGINVQLDYELDGLYWFRVSLDARFVTKIPLRLLTAYQQAASPR